MMMQGWETWIIESDEVTIVTAVCFGCAVAYYVLSAVPCPSSSFPDQTASTRNMLLLARPGQSRAMLANQLLTMNPDAAGSVAVSPPRHRKQNPNMMCTR